MNRWPPNPLKKLLGDLPAFDAQGDGGETEAWHRMQRRLAQAAPPATRGWLWMLLPTALGLAIAGTWLWQRPPVSLSRDPPRLAQKNAGSSAPPSPPNVPSVAKTTDVSKDEGPRLTAAETSIPLALPEASSLILEPHSQLQLAHLSSEQVLLRLVSGAVYVRAAPHRQGELRVETAGYAIIAHGTRFRVERAQGHLRVQLWRGSLEIAPPRGKSRWLEPGQQLEWGEREPLEQARLSALGPQAIPPEAVQNSGSDLTPAAGKPANLAGDVAHCRALEPVAAGTVLRLDLALAANGQVLSAAAERGPLDARVAGCLAEAALSWKLDPPPAALEGSLLIFPVQF